MSRRVAVLMGGWSAEREVSLVSGAAVADALRGRGHDVVEIDVGRDLPERLRASAPDVAFNALHGRWGEDGCVQGVLEVLGIAYTHSGVLASSLAMDKAMARRVLASAGIAVAEGLVVDRAAFERAPPFEPPYVVKPVKEGSSVGVTIVLDAAQNDLGDLPVWQFADEALVERYIPGREVQVAVMGDKALGAIEIRPFGRFYDYDTKYSEGRAEHVMPAPIHPSAYAEALDMALAAHRALGCRGVTRSDLRYDDTAGEPGRLVMLEVNTQPGMTPLSLVPEIAAHGGLSFADLVGWMVEDAGCDR